MRIILLLLVSAMASSGCFNTKPFKQIQTNNPEFLPNTVFIYYKDSSYPMFKGLREKIS